MKKLLIKLVLTTLLAISFGGTASAVSCKANSDCSSLGSNYFCSSGNCIQDIGDSTFNVKNILSIPDTKELEIEHDDGSTTTYATENQGLAYFQGPHSPIVNFILAVLNFMTRVIGSLAILLLIISGFRFMLSQGNSTEIDEAKEMVKYVIFGLLATFFSYLMVIFVESIFT
ncbi:hypothetical protein JKY72_02835 [Candidatus Gracilibacteria bacterium]|nr:hypothetical protein [Candidatus Gracilibacteria bacterium]